MLAISTDEGRQKSWIWSGIEWVVGLRSEREREGKVRVGEAVEVPGAPRVVRMWSALAGETTLTDGKDSACEP
jgi:hypothetical protein